MERTVVSSSHISSIGYDSNSSILEIEFLDGSVYQYFNVPEPVAIALMSASSHGAYLAKNIKGVYSYQKVG